MHSASKGYSDVIVTGCVYKTFTFWQMSKGPNVKG